MNEIALWLSVDEDLKRLTVEQLEFLVQPLTEPCLLAACPGSGKTQVVAHKMAYEAARWKQSHSGLAAITFTRNAASEIQARAAHLTTKTARRPHFIGTIHSWLYSYLLQPFAHSVMGFGGKADTDRSIRLISEDSNTPFLRSFLTPLGRSNERLPITAYFLDENDAPRTVSGLIQATDDVKRALINSKTRFAKIGFATHSDAEYWITKSLQFMPWLAPLLAKRFPFVIVDECQDLSVAQLRIFAALSNAGMTFHFVGDMNQSIHSFRGADQNATSQFAQSVGMRELRLSCNFRSIQAIVDASSHLVSAMPSRGRCDEESHAAVLLWQYDPKQNPYGLIPKFEAIVRQRGLRLDRSAVVARGSELVLRLQGHQKLDTSLAGLAALAFGTWNTSPRTAITMVEAMKMSGQFLHQTAYPGPVRDGLYRCPPDMPSSQWRFILSRFLRDGTEACGFQNQGKSLSWSSWCKNSLKPFLIEFWQTLPSEPTTWEEIAGRIKAPSRISGSVAQSVSPVQAHGSVRITTIHGVKGETLEAVLLVSNPDRRSPGGHWSHWLRDPQHEYARFAYVACTRARSLLIVAVPTLNAGDMERLRSIGLVAEEMAVASRQGLLADIALSC